MERARKALRGEDMTEIRAAQEELTRAFQEAGQSFYASQQAQGAEAGTPGAEQPAGAAAGAPGGGREDVVDADYEIVEDDRK